MLERVKQVIKENKYVQFALVLLLGIAIGTVFYPTKNIEEKLIQTHQEEIKILKEQQSKELLAEQTKYTQVTQQLSSYKQETEKKITSLTTEVSTLKKSQKTAYYKIIRLDGTIEIKKFTESESEASNQVITQIQQEFKQKIDSIENKWSTIHKERVTQITKEFTAKEEEYKKTIDTLEKSKTVTVNKRSFGIEGGALMNRNYYGHITYDVFGPVFIGVQTEFGTTSTIGGGVGLRF